MKNTVCLVLAVLVILFAINIPAYAVERGGHHGEGWHHGRGWHHGEGWHGDIWIGPGWGPWWWGPPYYPYYYPYYPERPAVIQQQPQIYVQPEEQYWYYCKDPEGYYPYVKKCPGGWLKVIPTTPPDEKE